MVPFLAPLLGSIAGSLLPATFGTGVAGALGLSGAAGGLIAAAAPKALGAGIGTFLAGGDLGDAALNAVGFGAGSTALSSMMGNAPGAAACSWNNGCRRCSRRSGVGSHEGYPSDCANPAGRRTAPSCGNAGFGWVMRPEQTMRNDIMAPNSQNQIGASAVNQMASTTVPTGGSSMMPAAVGIGSLPGMNNDTMLASFSPDQRNMINGHLGSQGMIGFA
jgi:hypothetical protein